MRVWGWVQRLLEHEVKYFYCFTQQAVESDRSGDTETAKMKNKISLRLSIFSIIIAVIANVSLIIISIVA